MAVNMNKSFISKKAQSNDTFVHGESDIFTLHNLLKLSSKSPESITPTFVLTIIKSNPRCVTHYGSFGMLPMHFAARNGVSKEVVEIIYTAYPGAVTEKDHAMNTPLHLAVKHNAPADVIIFLIDVFPDATRMRCRGGFIPLHFTGHQNASIEVINSLLLANPKGIKTTAGEDNITPLDLAIENGSSEEIQNLLQS
jgi:ankyrin repeat protein